MSKCLIIYQSYFHKNTEKIAAAMAEAAHAQLCKIDEIGKYDLSAFDLIGFGAGIAFHRHYDKLFKAIETLDLSDKHAFVFSTSGIGGLGQNKALIKTLTEKGAVVCGNFACRGYDTYGFLKYIGGIAKKHPNEKDFEKAKEFITGIL